MKSILFNAQSDAGFSGRLDAALDIARAFDAHLTLVHSLPYSADVSLDPYGAVFAAMIPVMREEGTKLHEATVADLANEDVRYDWVEEAGPVTLALLKHSMLSDLIVYGEPEVDHTRSGPSFAAGELALSANCPVLFLPYGTTRFDPETPAVVGWDGSAEASHALRAALPMLKKSKAVYLVSVEEARKPDTSHDLPPVSGADYLSRHGIRCEVVAVKAGDGGVAHALVEAANTRGAGLIVMGAYGRTRLSERVFGGATRAMLSNAGIPLLLAH
ncbi:universal stress protein [Qipengyuania zhejiangensis]|uniref:universal stress protein n=1 Tax=Qipengyuania zhejiangensis TaxID=3077782 RepID=UPI002D78E5A6|nr:universal stress protein [Qipengyuania sp. Z2]